MKEKVQRYIKLVLNENSDSGSTEFVEAESYFIANALTFAFEHCVTREVFENIGISAEVLDKAGIKSLQELVDGFVKSGRLYSRLHGFSHNDLRSKGIPAELLIAAGVNKEAPSTFIDQ